MEGQSILLLSELIRRESFLVHYFRVGHCPFLSLTKTCITIVMIDESQTPIAP